MPYMTACQRCGIEYDRDADRSANPHGHGAEPGPRETAPGTRVRVLHDARNYQDTIRAGEVGTVVHFGPEHHSQNGGGYDVELDLGRLFLEPDAAAPGDYWDRPLARTRRTVSVWSQWLEVAP